MSSAGFTAIPNAVLRNTKLSVRARLLYGIILSYAWGDDQGTAPEKLARECAISRTVFFDCVQQLKEEGLLEVKKRRNGRVWEAIYVPLARGVAMRDESDLWSPGESGNPDSQTSESGNPESARPDVPRAGARNGLKTASPDGEALVLLEQHEPAPDPVKEVFDHWQLVIPGADRKALTDPRRNRIRTRLKKLSVEELKKSIDGVLLDPWLLGENPQGRVYSDFKTIFKSDEKVHELMELVDDPPKPPAQSDKHGRSPEKVAEGRARMDRMLALVDEPEIVDAEVVA